MSKPQLPTQEELWHLKLVIGACSLVILILNAERFCENPETLSNHGLAPTGLLPVLLKPFPGYTLLTCWGICEKIHKPSRLL